ncbi:BT0820 family HAD-type phosphatase [Marinifilum caeruleilacunae]|uniref:Hydrolase n=1 Tax=Marinifilum caeruleilacunae TaxID=2499076 RepID=A0ABX1WT65_9BACT|nr:hydrolase [Marinifilum caeruleilacunae]NOU59291.1 hydrolase [Marinifilum caeruleilacunae]
MIIAVDFDGTIVQHKYPQIGAEIPFAIESLIELQKEGHQLILWTYRTGDLLDEAVEYCESRGLVFYAVNKNYPEEEFDETVSRKVYADLYIDDRNIGGLRDWGHIYQMISTKEDEYPPERKTKNSFSRFLDNLFGE